MKILQVNCVYNNGSTGKIVYDIHRGLQAEGIESVVCYGRGQKVSEPNVYKTSSEIIAKFNALRSRITGLQYNGSWIATNKLISIIRKEHPDIVHLHCINGYFVNIYRLFEFLKKNKIRTVLTLHAEFMHTGNCGHAYDCEKWMTGCGQCTQLWNATKSYYIDRTHAAWVRMQKAFEGFDALEIVSVSQWLQYRAMQSPIMKGHRFSVIWNGIDTKETFHPCDFQYLKEKHGLKDEKILLHVTANFSLREDDKKGGRYIVKLAERLSNENIKFVVVGGRDLTIPLPENIINVGCINNQKELAAYYSMADITVLTSERETFSMVCAESLSCGTPVVGFKAGAPEQISLPEYSEFVEYGDMDTLVEALNRWMGMKCNCQQDIVRKSEARYSREKMCEKYRNLYANIAYGLDELCV
jgi:putative colanic acid biosynthesis glycosyltransferase